MARFHIVLALCLAVCGVAIAQSATRWTDPGGHFSLDYTPLGWSQLARNAGDGLLQIEHRQFQQGGLMRMCVVTQRSMPAPIGIDQPHLNIYTAGRTSDDLARALGNTPTHLDHSDVDGVTVIDGTFDQPLYQHMRVFYLSADSSVMQFVINCGATPPVSPDVVSNIEALLETLHIHSP